MDNPRSLRFTCDVKVPPAEAYRAFVHETALRDWLCDTVRAGVRVGGHLFLGWDDGYNSIGQFERLDPGNSLAFGWKGPDEPGLTHVEVSFEPLGEGTRVTLVHGGIGEGDEWDAVYHGFQDNWPPAMDNLQSLLETGLDLRIVRRPRLGIIYDQFNQQVAQKLGVPVNEGVLIVGTAEGSGARAAGLVENDVLVSMNGKKLVDGPSFGPALEGLKAGDRPTVEFYRGAEKHNVPLQLGSFPVPDAPQPAKELAAQAAEIKNKVLASMRELSQGLSDEQAGKRPADDTWSVKELVGHFILMERDFQSWAADMLNDTPVEDFLEMRPNVNPRISAAITRFDTLDALLAELALAQAETITLISNLPGSFVSQRKHLYRRITAWETENEENHYFEEHQEQFKGAIAAAGN